MLARRDTSPDDLEVRRLSPPTCGPHPANSFKAGGSSEGGHVEGMTPIQLANNSTFPPVSLSNLPPHHQGGKHQTHPSGGHTLEPLARLPHTRQASEAGARGGVAPACDDAAPGQHEDPAAARGVLPGDGSKRGGAGASPNCLCCLPLNLSLSSKQRFVF